MSEGILTREEVEGLPLDLSGWSTLDIITTALALYDSQAADRERNAALERALTEIANHPHCAYEDGPFIGEHDSGYKMGIADGHRCAANVARAALQATPPQEE